MFVVNSPPTANGSVQTSLSVFMSGVPPTANGSVQTSLTVFVFNVPPTANGSVQTSVSVFVFNVPPTANGSVQTRDGIVQSQTRHKNTWKLIRVSTVGLSHFIYEPRHETSNNVAF